MFEYRIINFNKNICLVLWIFLGEKILIWWVNEKIFKYKWFFLKGMGILKILISDVNVNLG